MSKCCTTDFSGTGTISLPERSIADLWKVVYAEKIPATHINTAKAVKNPAPQKANPICCPKTRIFYTASGEMIEVDIGCSK
jgi:hypothetical protein